MKPTPYLKSCLKSLDKDLRNLSKENKIRYLDHYRYGLEFGLRGNYPDKFAFPSGEVQITDDLTHKAYWGAYEISDQFGPLEVESTRKFLLEAMEKRKKKFSKPGFLEKLYRLCCSSNEKV